MIKAAPQNFRSAIKKAAATATAVFAADGIIDRLQSACHRDVYRHYPGSFKVDWSSVWVCGPCWQVFQKKAHLACHLLRKHGRRAECRYFLEDAVCKACGKDYERKDRLQLHLSTCRKCWAVVRSLGATCAAAPPGIGSKLWKQQRRERPTLHPAAPADVFEVSSTGFDRVGETPGQQLVRNCTWELGEWISVLDSKINAAAFFKHCVHILMRFPLYPSEMQDVVSTVMSDVSLCVEEELLDWSIEWGCRLRQWLQICHGCLTGSWLCEWADIDVDVEHFSGHCDADQIADVIRMGVGSSLPCSLVLTVCTSPAQEERTLKPSDTTVTHCSVRWDDLDSRVTDPRTTTCIASLPIPGEAIAGSRKATIALDRAEINGMYCLASTIMSWTPSLRSLWRLYLQGCRVCLCLSGPGCNAAVANRLQPFIALGWKVSLADDGMACLLSQGVQLSKGALCFTFAN